MSQLMDGNMDKRRKINAGAKSKHIMRACLAFCNEDMHCQHDWKRSVLILHDKPCT